VTARLLAIVLLSSTASASTQVHYVMGTFLRVVVDEDAPPAVFDECFARARALDRTFSRFDPKSELVRLNAAAGGPASAEFRRVLDRALELARATHGSFDPSVGAVTALWRAPEPPAAAAIAAARRTVGRVGADGERVTLGVGTVLDFDGFAKGVAVDACVDSLRAAGVTRALVSFGESSLYGLGAPRGADAWTLDVRGPDPAVAVGRLKLRDRGAAVSAVFGAAGRGAGRRAHVVDPRTGRPLRDDAASVIVASSATDAEAWAKAVLVAGPGGVRDAETRGDVEAARLDRRGVAMGDALRGSGALWIFARPRALAREVAFR
jgi:thiamine biosynthesis lipoprotein